METVPTNGSSASYEFLKLAGNIPPSKEKVFYDVLVKGNHNLESFLTLSSDLNTLKASSVEREQIQLSSLGFQKIKLRTGTRLTCTMFLENTALVLEQQIGKVQDEKVHLRPGSQIPSLLSMNAEIVFLVCRAVEQHTNSPKSLESDSETAANDTMQSVMGYVQVSSDKS